MSIYLKKKDLQDQANFNLLGSFQFIENKNKKLNLYLKNPNN